MTRTARREECGMEYVTRVRVPQVQSLGLAIRLYYEKVELSVADIVELFGCTRPTARKLRLRGREEMEASGTPTWNEQNVNTECAFRAWGLDIEKMEHSLQRLRRLKLVDG